MTVVIMMKSASTHLSPPSPQLDRECQRKDMISGLCDRPCHRLPHRVIAVYVVAPPIHLCPSLLLIPPKERYCTAAYCSCIVSPALIVVFPAKTSSQRSMRPLYSCPSPCGLRGSRSSATGSSPKQERNDTNGENCM